MPGRRTRDLAAVVECRHGEARVCGTGAYATARHQFGTSIGKFEGVQEALARMGGNLYVMDAARRLSAQAVDLGEKPSVISGIAKYHITEHAGKGICMGPSNFLARAYQQMPISITVEGANILTRSLIIFGQGAIRCHPYVLKEMAATRDADRARRCPTAAVLPGRHAPVERVRLVRGCVDASRSAVHSSATSSCPRG